jgi:hypothetical protein
VASSPLAGRALGSCLVASDADHRVAVALEAGVIAVYDKRAAQSSLARWVGHGADVHCVQWHPSFPNVLASAAASPDYTVKIWDLTHTPQPGVGQVKPLFTISPAGNVHRLRWRPSAPVGLPEAAACAAAGAGAGAATAHAARSRSASSVESGSEGDDADVEPAHVWQLATECHHRGSVIQVWDVREPVMPIAVVHPPAPSFFDGAATADATAGSSSSSSSSSVVVPESAAVPPKNARRVEVVEYVGFEWLDTPAPRALLPDAPAVPLKKKPDADVAVPWTLFGSLAASAAKPPPLPRHKAREKEQPDEDVYLGLWQHFLTTVKVGASGAVLVNSCGAAIQPPSEVAPVALAFAPTGHLAAVHQEQPIAHRATPPFHLASTRVDYGPGGTPHPHPPLGIFHVHPQNANAAAALHSRRGPEAAPTRLRPAKPVLKLEALHHKLRYAPLQSSLLRRHARRTSPGGSNSDVAGPWFGGGGGVGKGATRDDDDDDAWTSSYGEAFAGVARSPETATRSHRRWIELAACEGAVPSQLGWGRADVAQWHSSEKRGEIAKAEAEGGGDGAPLPFGAFAVNAAELAARVLGHGSARAMQLLLEKNPDSLSSEVRRFFHGGCRGKHRDLDSFTHTRTKRRMPLNTKTP